MTNPYEADVEGLRLLGTSGQCVADVQRYTSVSCLDITTPAPTLDYVTALGDGPVPGAPICVYVCVRAHALYV